MRLGIPNRAFFSYAFPCSYRRIPPCIDGQLDDWDPSQQVPDLGFLDDLVPIALVYMAWNEDGLYFAVSVKKRHPVRVSPRQQGLGDCFQVWIDTRDVKTARRAGRYCHQFNFMPLGGGKEGKKALAKPTQIDRHKEPWPLPRAEAIPIAANITQGGYTLEVALPKTVLNGYQPREFRRLGFTYLINTPEGSSQWWSASRRLHVYEDPSTWGTAELVK